MDKIEWTQALKTGIELIDKQHKEFIKDCADAVISAEKGERSNKLTAAFKKLEKKAVEHFATEAGFMEGSQYPDTKGHKKLHGFFLEELKALEKRGEAGETGDDFAVEIKERLADWFILHIQKNDLKMVSYIVKK